jgi:hypothetical protein
VPVDRRAGNGPEDRKSHYVARSFGLFPDLQMILASGVLFACLFAFDAAVYHLINRCWLLKIFLHSEGIFFFAHSWLTGLF